MRGLSSFLALSLLVGTLARARAADAEPDTSTVSEPEAYRLANGLRVVLAPDSVVAGVRVVVSYDVGAAYDPASYRGLAHLVEHLTFRGSRHVKPLQGTALLDELGASWNAYTALEKTKYLTAAPTRALETIFWIESERMGFALDGIDESALQLEQAIVANELGQRARSLARIVDGEERRALYGAAHPFTPARNESEDVQAVELSGLRWFFQSTYRPDNATLVVVGSFESAAARRWIEQYFGPLKNPRLPRRVVRRPAPVLCGVRHVDIGHPFLFGRQMVFSWPLPAQPSPVERARLGAMAELLEVRLRDGLVRHAFKAAEVSVGLSDYESHGLLSVALRVQEGADWKFIEAAVRDEAERLSSSPLDEAELRTLRINASSRYVFTRTHGMEWALALANGQQLQAERAALGTLDGPSVMATARLLNGPHLVLRVEPSRRAYRGAIVLADEGGCP
jgi:zinc protease